MGSLISPIWVYLQSLFDLQTNHRPLNSDRHGDSNTSCRTVVDEKQKAKGDSALNCAQGTRLLWAKQQQPVAQSLEQFCLLQQGLPPNAAHSCLLRWPEPLARALSSEPRLYLSSRGWENPSTSATPDHGQRLWKQSTRRNSAASEKQTGGSRASAAATHPAARPSQPLGRRGIPPALAKRRAHRRPAPAGPVSRRGTPGCPGSSPSPPAEGRRRGRAGVRGGSRKAWRLGSVGGSSTAGLLRCWRATSLPALSLPSGLRLSARRRRPGLINARRGAGGAGHRGLDMILKSWYNIMISQRYHDIVRGAGGAARAARVTTAVRSARVSRTCRGSRARGGGGCASEPSWPSEGAARSGWRLAAPTPPRRRKANACPPNLSSAQNPLSWAHDLF